MINTRCLAASPPQAFSEALSCTSIGAPVARTRHPPGSQAGFPLTVLLFPFGKGTGDELLMAESQDMLGEGDVVKSSKWWEGQKKDLPFL